MKSVFFLILFSLIPNLAAAESPSDITAQEWVESGDHARSLYIIGYVEATKTILNRQRPPQTLVFPKSTFSTYTEIQEDVFNFVASQPKLRPYSMAIILAAWVEDRAKILPLGKTKDLRRQ